MPMAFCRAVMSRARLRIFAPTTTPTSVLATSFTCRHGVPFSTNGTTLARSRPSRCQQPCHVAPALFPPQLTSIYLSSPALQISELIKTHVPNLLRGQVTRPTLSRNLICLMFPFTDAAKKPKKKNPPCYVVVVAAAGNSQRQGQCQAGLCQTSTRDLPTDRGERNCIIHIGRASISSQADLNLLHAPDPCATFHHRSARALWSNKSAPTKSPLSPAKPRARPSPPSCSMTVNSFRSLRSVLVVLA